MSFTLAIVGRPNVGKSTLFNRLVGKRLALVDDQPGVTRDLREGAARLGHLKFTVIDTAGLEEASDESLQGRMRKLTERAVDMAATSVFSLDRRQHQNYSEDVLEHSKEALAKLVGNLPAPLQSRLNEQVCENVALEGIALLECRLTADGTSPFLPQLSLGFMGTFPPQPSELSVKAAVAF